MRDLLSLFVLLFLVVQPLKAQQQSTPYFKDVVIIKYESNDALQKINAAQGKPVQEVVQSVMNPHGVKEIEPFWKEQYSTKVQQMLTRKNKRLRTGDPAADLKRIYTMKYSGNIDPVMLSKKLSAIPGVEYAEPKYIYETMLDPNDPTTNKYYTVHNFIEAWDITTGSSDVVIAVIDGGVNYEHEDLINKAWVNEAEIPDNGVDDDDNGFVDDYYGWDFWQSGLTFENIVQDNDPLAEYTDHGSHVAGIAAAEGNNNLGTAGTGFDSRYMAVKAGGIQDNPSTSETDESRLIGFGLDGILYAAINGADIINCSFGGPNASSAGQEVIDYALSLGALVVAASGNDGLDIENYPAAYNGVLSVGSVSADSIITSYSNFGYSLDVLATGSAVYSIRGFENNGYGINTGTSMASPVVAGLAALIKAEHPDWSPDRIRTQIRSSSIPLSGVSDPSLYGNGTIDAYAALTDLKPGIDVYASSISDVDGNSLGVGESGIMQLDITNYGETTSALTISVTAKQDEIEITSDASAVGTLAEGDSITVEFEFDLPEDYDLSDTPAFIISFEDPSSDYIDYEVVVFDNLNFGVISANNVTVSFGANGTIGFSDPSGATGGVGFIPAGYSNILYEGGIIMMEGGSPLQGTDPALANNVRSQVTYDNDFDPDITFGVDTPGEVSDADGSGSFVPNNFAGFGGTNTTLNTFAYSEENLQNVIFAQYEIQNTSNAQLKDFYMGIFTDWDVNNFSNNNIRYNSAENFMYIYDATPDNGYPYVAVAAMQTTSANLAMNNGYEGNETPFRFNLYDGYSDNEKRNSMRAGTNTTTVTGADVSSLVASGPYVIGPGATVSLGFIYAYGSDPDELEEFIISAKEKGVFEVDEPGTYTGTEEENLIPYVTKLEQNYPNPFNPATDISFELAETGLTELSVYNILGQKVQTLVNSTMAAGAHTVNFNASALSSGVYLVVLKTNNLTKTIKMTLLK